MYLRRMTYLTMSISSQEENWLFYLQTMGDRDIDEDSGDENQLLPNNLNRSQLLAGAAVDLSASSGNSVLGAGDEEEVAGLSVDVPSKKNKGSKVNAFL